jgi:hypothetical protein
MSFPSRTLDKPVRFILDVGTDGFNAYRLAGDGSSEIIAASSSMSTFVKVMEQIANVHQPEGDERIRFGCAERVG